MVMSWASWLRAPSGSGETLLEQAEERCAALKSALDRADIEFQIHRLDLKRFPVGLTAMNPNLITVSAFIDLVSVDWLSKLVTYALMERIPVYTALTYSGSVAISPEDPSDARMIEAVNRHQLTDKGFGPALGPAAADRIGKLFKGVRQKGWLWKLEPLAPAVVAAEEEAEKDEEEIDAPQMEDEPKPSEGSDSVADS